MQTAALAALLAILAWAALAGPVSAAAHRSSATTRTAQKTAWRTARTKLIGVGNVHGCLTGSSSGLGVLRSYHASVLRVVIDPIHGANGQALGCVRAAARSRHKVEIAVNYFNAWSTSHIVSYFRHVLAAYGHYAWAISIGNEQDLNQGGHETAARYAAVWRAVEPVVAHKAPHAIRVAGEISPWGFAFLKSALAKRLPGAQVIAVHAYIGPHVFKLAKVVTWAHGKGLPLWVTEGLKGPGAWSRVNPNLQAAPLSKMRGVAFAAAWLS